MPTFPSARLTGVLERCTSRCQSGHPLDFQTTSEHPPLSPHKPADGPTEKTHMSTPFKADRQTHPTCCSLGSQGRGPALHRRLVSPRGRVRGHRRRFLRVDCCLPKQHPPLSFCSSTDFTEFNILIQNNHCNSKNHSFHVETDLKSFAFCNLR